MLVLSYLWILALIPWLTEKEDGEVQWHAKHGLVLLAAEFILGIILAILMQIPVFGCIIGIVWLLISVGIIVLHVVCIAKAVNGERFLVPGVSQYADRF